MVGQIKKIHSKVYNHPDRDLIIKWIGEGKGDREIAKILKEKYPSQHHSHLRISYKSIYSFRQEHMPGGKLNALAITETNTPRWAIQNRKIAERLSKNSAYQEAVAKIKEEEIRVTRKLVEVMSLLESRMEAVYNELVLSSKIDERSEKLLLEQMKVLLGILSQQDRINNAAVVQQNTSDVTVNISIVRDHASIIREAIRETLSEVDPALSIEFMERINLKMKDLEYTEETGLLPM